MEVTAELVSEEERRRARGNYLFVAAVALFFTSLIAPYREIHIPRVLMAFLFFGVGIMCAKFVLDDFAKVLLLLVVYAPFQKVLPGDLGGLMTAFNLTNVLALFVVIGWLLQSPLRDTPFYKRRAPDVVLLIFCCLNAAALVRGAMLAGTDSLWELTIQLKRWLLPMFMYYAFVNTVNSKQTLKEIVVAVCVTTALIGALGVKEYYLDMGGLWHEFSSYRASSITVVSGQPNQLAALFVYYTFYIAAFFLVNIAVTRYWLLVPVVFLCGRSLLLTFSRGGNIAFTMGGLALTYLWNRKVFYFVVVPVAALLIAYPTLIPGVFVGRLGETIQALRAKPEPLSEDPTGSRIPGLDPSAQDRLKVWKAGARMIRDYPLAGVGYGQFTKEIGRYAPELDGVDSHNTYIQIATEMGVPALVLFLWVLFIFWRQAWYVYRRTTDRFLKAFSIGYLAGMAGLLVANVFGSRLNTDEIALQFWLLSAMAVKAREYTEEELRSAKESSSG